MPGRLKASGGGRHPSGFGAGFHASALGRALAEVCMTRAGVWQKEPCAEGEAGHDVVPPSSQSQPLVDQDSSFHALLDASSFQALLDDSFQALLEPPSFQALLDASFQALLEPPSKHSHPDSDSRSSHSSSITAILRLDTLCQRCCRAESRVCCKDLNETVETWLLIDIDRAGLTGVEVSTKLHGEGTQLSEDGYRLCPCAS